MKPRHEKHRARDLGVNDADLAWELGGRADRIDHPAEIADAVYCARRQAEE